MNDPLLELVQDYRQQLAAFDRSPASLTDDEDQALAATTWAPLYNRLCNAPPHATTLNGAIEAVRLVRDEEAKCSFQPDLTINVLGAALAFFDEKGEAE